MKFKLTKLATALVGAAVLALAGCGGGGGGSSETAATVTAVTVSPSLGKFSDGVQVKISTLGGSALGNAVISGGTGTAVVNIPASHSGPILIEVSCKDNSCSYFDEKYKASKPFVLGEKLRAFAPTVRAAVGVTPATNAAVVALETAKSLTTVTADDISSANNRIQVALGLTDLLQAPTLLDGTDEKLDIANPGDVYALILAALANLAGDNQTALDVAKSLADDLSDSKIDGKKGINAISGLAYAFETFEKDMVVQKIAAALSFASTNSQQLINNEPTILGNIDTDVSDISIPPGVNTTELQKAKAFFAELRTTLIATFGLDGFLDLQAFKAGDDLNATVAPKVDVLSHEIDALTLATRLYKSVQGTDTLAYEIKPNPSDTSVNAFVYRSENCSSNDIYYGGGTCNVCYTDTAVASTVTKARCDVFDASNVDYADQKIKTVSVSVSLDPSNQYKYEYSAFQRSFDVSIDGSSNVTFVNPQVVNSPEGEGTLTVAVNGSSEITALAIAGTLPASTAETSVDTVALNVAFTEPAADTVRLNLSGSVATSNTQDTTKTAKLKIETGSYIEEKNIANTPRAQSAKIIGTIESAANKFTGVVTLGAFEYDKSNTAYEPTNIVFEGSISDLTSGGAGEYLTGKLELTNSLANWNDRLGVSSDNFESSTATFTGTVKMPERPEMKLVLAGTDTTQPGTEPTASVNYSYDTVRITGSVTATGELVLSNQDGIQITEDSLNRHVFLVTKAGSRLATVTNNTVDYVDGSSYSLK